jgi:ElaB/YqjD/DUF883 family membrane-anchored ribosome-binding protein
MLLLRWSLSEHKEIQLRDIEELVRNLRKDVDVQLADLKAQLNVAQKKATSEIEERPMLALGVAFIVGMAIGIALPRPSD